MMCVYGINWFTTSQRLFMMKILQKSNLQNFISYSLLIFHPVDLYSTVFNRGDVAFQHHYLVFCYILNINET